MSTRCFERQCTDGALPGLPARAGLLLAEPDGEVAARLADEGIKVTKCLDGAEVLLRAGMDRLCMVLLGVGRTSREIAGLLA
ncbi:hypothetical protein ACFVGN_02315 [Streptomyces sp. NPDC057757]|uniref:hypothetical protein n=1 Tax=Streptomyces sp. NPDC057757 TaxID=3346241 RepID=UPI0036CF1E0D